MSIQLLKLVTGEEVIGDFNYDTEGCISISNPYMVIFMPTQKGMQIMLKPYWENHVEEPNYLTVFYEHCLQQKHPVQQLLDMYHKVTSPIDLPPKGLVL